MWDDDHPSPDVVNSCTASFIFIIGVVGQWDMSSRESHQYLDNVQRCSSALSHYRNLQFHVYCLSMIYIVAGVRMPMPRTGPHKIPGICPTLMIFILRAIHLSSCPEWTYSCRRLLYVDRFDQNRNFLSSHASILFHLSSISVFTILEHLLFYCGLRRFPDRFHVKTLGCGGGRYSNMFINHREFGGLRMTYHAGAVSQAAI